MATAVKENNSIKLEALAVDFATRVVKEKSVYPKRAEVDTVFLYGHELEELKMIRDSMRRYFTEREIGVHVSIGEVRPSEYISTIDVGFFYTGKISSTSGS